MRRPESLRSDERWESGGLAMNCPRSSVLSALPRTRVVLEIGAWDCSVVPLAAACCCEAELGDRKEELATPAESALLIGPGLRLLLAHPALFGHVLFDQRQERAAVGIRDELGRREGVGVHPDVLEPSVA